MQYSPTSLLIKSVRGDMVPSKRIKDCLPNLTKEKPYKTGKSLI